jgi:hypothetical protein
MCMFIAVDETPYHAKNDFFFSFFIFLTIIDQNQSTNIFFYSAKRAYYLRG